jgi:hypothetical protein
MGEPITLSGDFGFQIQDGQLRISARDVTIDGLPIRKFGWAWFGMALAEGAVHALGGMVFTAVVSALRQDNEPGLSELLNQQLAEFAQIVQRALDAHMLKSLQAKLEGFVLRYTEYCNDPSDSSLELILHDSAEVVAGLRNLSLAGYRSYMIAAGLRLTAL